MVLETVQAGQAMVNLNLASALHVEGHVGMLCRREDEIRDRRGFRQVKPFALAAAVLLDQAWQEQAQSKDGPNGPVARSRKGQEPAHENTLSFQSNLV